MRWILETTQEGNEVAVWNTINSLKEKGLISIVEKGDPIEDMKERLRKVTRAMQLLQEVGLNAEVMEAYLYVKTGVSRTNIKKILYQQNEFFESLGVKLK